MGRNQKISYLCYMISLLFYRAWHRPEFYGTFGVKLGEVFNKINNMNRNQFYIYSLCLFFGIIFSNSTLEEEFVWT